MITLEAWQDIHNLWFERMYNTAETDDQFLWQKRFVFDQLLGRSASPDALQAWSPGPCLLIGLMRNGKVFGAGALCRIDGTNSNCEMKLLVDPLAVLTPDGMRQAIKKILEYAFNQGIERVYGYWPKLDDWNDEKRRGRAYRLWERAIRQCSVRRVGLERHAIRTAKRLIGRVQYEAIRGCDGIG